MLLHAITTGKQDMHTLTEICASIHNMVDAIHLREKSWTAADYARAVNTLSARGVPLNKVIINDRTDVAWAMRVGGVQLGFASLNAATVKNAFPSLVAGSSVHSIGEALQRQQEGADYVLFGHVFATDSKPGCPPRGLKQLQAIVETLHIPVLAIGGITPEHVPVIAETGAAGIAAMSGIFQAACPAKAVMAYRRNWKVWKLEKRR